MKAKFLRTLIFSIVFALLAIAAEGQRPQLYNTTNGLENSKINSLYQDTRGFLWIATENGLFRFDGESFYDIQKLQKPGHSLASTLVLCVFEDSQGTFWIGTSSGLQILDKDSLELEDFSLEDGTKDRTHIAKIIEVPTEKGNSELWVATSSRGIYIFDVKTHKLNVEKSQIVSSSFTSPYVYTTFLDSELRVWISGENGGLTLINSQSGKTASSKLLGPEFDTMTERLYVTDFAEDKLSGKILIGTQNYGLLIFDPQKGYVTRSEDPEARSCDVMSILPDSIISEGKEQTFLIGTEDHGLKTYDLRRDKMREGFNPSIPEEGKHWKVHDILEDKQGNVWLGVYHAGIFMIPRSMYGFETSYSTSSCASSIATNPVDGSLWIGTDGGGLLRIGKDGGKTEFKKENSGLTSNDVQSIAFDKRGVLWIATYQGGLCRYSEGSVRPFADSGKLGSKKTYTLTYDESRDILYVGTHGEGLCIIDTRDERLVKKIDAEDCRWICSLYVDSSDLLWIGGYKSPIYYSPDLDRLVHFSNDETGLSSRIYCFAEGHESIMWIGTGDGLVEFEKGVGDANEAGIRQVYTTSDGLTSNVICALLVDGEGLVWASTSNGLCCLDPKTKIVRKYYYYDGLQDNEFHYRSAFKTRSGDLIFGGVRGITRFDPQSVARKTHQMQPIYLSSLEFKDRKQSPPAELKSITLPYQHNTFSLHFSIPEFTNPSKLIYQYKLEGLESEFKTIETGIRNISYTDLDPGKYTLRIKSFYSNEEEGAVERTLKLRIQSPWYQSWWAWLLYCLFAVTLLFFVAIFLKSRRELLEKRKETELKEGRLKTLTSLSQEIRTPMTLVMSPLRQMRDNCADLRQKDLYNLMYRNCHRILRLINQILDSRKLDSDQMEFHFRSTDMEFFIRDIMRSFDHSAENRNIKASLQSEAPDDKLWIDQGHFDKVVFNILAYAFQHTQMGGKIVVRLMAHQPNKGELRSDIAEFAPICISCSPCDIKLAELASEATTGSNLGLTLARKLMEHLHGRVSASDNAEGGLDFHILVAVGESHLSSEEKSATSIHQELYTRYYEGEEVDHEDLTTNPEEDGVASKESKTRRNIVIVDTDAELRSYLRSELSRNYNVKTYDNPRLALEQICNTLPDFVLTELNLPEMTGDELCAKIKHNLPTNHIPVIVMSSSSDEDEAQKGLESGADMFLTKPLSIDLLRSSISRVISTRETIKNKFSSESSFNYDDITLKTKSVKDKLLTDVMAALTSHIDDPAFGVEELSKAVGLSRVHLNRKLKESLGTSPGNLIKSTRLRQAAYLLINNEANVSEVAYRIGFSSPSYFSSAFHDYFGLSPKEFTAKYSGCTDADTLEKLFGSNFRQVFNVTSQTENVTKVSN